MYICIYCCLEKQTSRRLEMSKYDLFVNNYMSSLSEADKLQSPLSNMARATQGWIQSSSSDLHKSLKFVPNLISQLFIAVDEINYPPCFNVYYEIKQLRDYSVDHTANPAPPERSGRVTVRAVSSFVDLSRTTRRTTPKKIRRHDRTKFLPRG